jgi:hypothetical protein
LETSTNDCVALQEIYAIGLSSVSISYAIRPYIHAAVHTPDRVTTGVEMSIPSNIGEARETRSRDTGLQFVVGQDEIGRWVAVESQGRAGGISSIGKPH